MAPCGAVDLVRAGRLKTLRKQSVDGPRVNEDSGGLGTGRHMVIALGDVQALDPEGHGGAGPVLRQFPGQHNITD